MIKSKLFINVLLHKQKKLLNPYHKIKAKNVSKKPKMTKNKSKMKICFFCQNDYY